MPKNQPIDARAEVRSNVLLSAVLSTVTGSVPVRVRNLSPHGALIDGKGLPSVGTAVLRRGNLWANGEVAWLGEDQWGLHFTTGIDVKAWVQRVAHPEQERVDGIVAALRDGALPLPCEPPESAMSLEAIIEGLVSVIDGLANVPELTTDIAEQILRLESFITALRRHA